MANSQLGLVLRSQRFRRLFAVRITGQFSDGLFQAALATFVLFSPERQASPAAIAAAFAILYLPYSVVGPFVGVLLDRWNRRQVLLLGNCLRSVVVLVVCLITAAGHAGLDLGLAVLVALGINRFILAGLAAALPHTVDRGLLVTANAFAPTAGTLFAAVGGLVGVVGRAAFGGGDSGSVAVLALATLGFVVAGLLSLRLPKHSLGPDGQPVADTLGTVAAGLLDGIRVLWRARSAFRAVSIVTIHRIAFGGVMVLAILLLRHTINPVSNPEAALAGLSFVIGGAAGGALVGAIITPYATPRIGPSRLSAMALGVAAVLTPAGLALETLPSLIVSGVALGFAGQTVKICADTAVQRQLADDHRGRVFTLYDVAVNIGLVVGVAGVAFTSSESGRSTFDLVVVGLLLAGAAGWGAAGWRHDPLA